MAQDLVGQRILVTSGPTRANIDAVRFISNRSSGRLGRTISRKALALGAHVTMVAGHGSVTPDPDELTEDEADRLGVLPVETVSDLIQTLDTELTNRPPYSAVVHAMAVLDYVPVREEAGKVRSGRDTWELKLTRTPKVIRKIKEWSPRTFLVGFKLEVEKSDDQLQKIATAMMKDTRSDLVVANDLSRIRDEQHPALILGTGGNIVSSPETKGEIAAELCAIFGRVLE